MWLTGGRQLGPDKEVLGPRTESARVCRPVARRGVRPRYCPQALRAQSQPGVHTRREGGVAETPKHTLGGRRPSARGVPTEGHARMSGIGLKVLGAAGRGGSGGTAFEVGRWVRLFLHRSFCFCPRLTISASKPKGGRSPGDTPPARRRADSRWTPSDRNGSHQRPESLPGPGQRGHLKGSVWRTT